MARNFHEIRRENRKSLILETLGRIGKPQTTGELFLLTGINQGTLKNLLNELVKESLVKKEIKPSVSKTYPGYEIIHQAIHWELVSLSKSIQE
jgi:DNA-binding HxlR family transcriptional regulator